jgi:hypothetical protein
MAKITKKYQRIFAGDVPANNILAEFGSLKDGSIAYSDDPAEIQSRTAWVDGLQSALINNYNPAVQDINSLLYVITRQISYLQQQGLTEWSSLVTYYEGSLVLKYVWSDYRRGVAIFESLTNDNLNNQLSDLTKWRCIKTNIITAYVTGAGGISTDISYDDYFYTVYTHSSSPISVYLPTASNGLKGRTVIVSNRWYSPPTLRVVRVYVKDSSTIDGNAFITLPKSGAHAHFICSGSSWHLIDNLSPA